jgi:Domain of unknown function (DUF927)
MNTQQFLATVLPSGANFAVVVPEGDHWRHTWRATDVLATAPSLLPLMPPTVATAPKVYFSCAGYTASGSEWGGRTKANASSIKALWLDIDAGAVKHEKHGDQVYRTQYDAVMALGQFCKDHFVSPTFIVDSGAGLHAYWAFDQPVEAKVWAEKIAPRFAQLCASSGLRVDPTRTCDTASVLRLPGTRAGDKLVSILHKGPVHPILSLLARLPKQLDGKAPTYRTGPTTTDYPPYRAVWMLKKAQAGKGCEQLRRLLEEGGNVQEPLWRAGLATVQHGDDSPENKTVALAAISRKHPEFSLPETLRKAGETRAPYTCEAWAAINPEACKGCRYSSMLRSPCRFGSEENTAKWEQACELPRPNLPTTSLIAPPNGFGREEPDEEPLLGLVFEDTPPPTVADTTKDHVANYRAWLASLPNLTPFKIATPVAVPPMLIVMGGANDGGRYLTGQWCFPGDASDFTALMPVTLGTGPEAQMYGITRIAKNAAGECIAQVVSDGTLIPTKTVLADQHTATESDPGGGLHVQFYNPAQSGSIVLPPKMYSAAGKADQLCTALTALGLNTALVAVKGLVMYLQAASSRIIANRASSAQVHSMGWTASGGFVLGTTEHTATGEARSVALARSISQCQTIGTTQGTLTDWNNLLRNMYVTGGDADLPLQFAVLAGFGAPVHARGQDTGGIIHLFSTASAAGKTTVQRVIAAIYDAPKSPTNAPTILMAAKSDTMHARVHKLGMLNSLPLLNDEVTEMGAQQVADFIYTSTQGRAKDRMASDSNKLRENTSFWGAYTVTSSNRRLSDLYDRVMQDTEGMAKRVLEVDVPPVRIRGGLAYDAQVVDPLLSGAVYGVAGKAWIAWLAANWEQVATQKNAILERLVVDAGLTRADRFFANMAASALVAGAACQRLGLHPFDMKAMYGYVVDLLRSTTRSTNAKTNGLISHVRAFITRNASRINRIDAQGGFVAQMHQPLGGPIGVFDKSTNSLCLSEQELLDLADKHNASRADMHRMLAGMGKFATLKISADDMIPRARCVIIDISSDAARVLFSGD